MMLFALTSRSRYTRCARTSRFCNAWTSLAEARACRPRRLPMTTLRSSMIDEDPSTPAAGRGRGELVERLFGIVEHPQQHRQVEPRYAMHAHAEVRQPLGDVARR